MRTHASRAIGAWGLPTLGLMCSLPWIAGCSADPPVGPVGNRTTAGAPPAASAPRIDSISISMPGTTILGSAFTLHAFVFRSDGSRIEASEPRWSTPYQWVLAVNSVTGSAVAVGIGTTIVTVNAEGVAASATLTVQAPPGGGTSDALTVDAFSVVEFEYESLPGRKFYAPQLLVTAAPSGSVTVLTLEFHVPGLDDRIPTIACGGRVPPGGTRQLNGEVYGDWTFFFDDPGHRATGEPATAVVRFIDNTGATGAIRVHGPIEPGGLPTYTGGRNSGACFHGYGSDSR
jgi:hypothetical protein